MCGWVSLVYVLYIVVVVVFYLSYYLLLPFIIGAIIVARFMLDSLSAL